MDLPFTKKGDYFFTFRSAIRPQNLTLLFISSWKSRKSARGSYYLWCSWETCHSWKGLIKKHCMALAQKWAIPLQVTAWQVLITFPIKQILSVISYQHKIIIANCVSPNPDTFWSFTLMHHIRYWTLGKQHNNVVLYPPDGGTEDLVVREKRKKGKDEKEKDAKSP